MTNSLGRKLASIPAGRKAGTALDDGIRYGMLPAVFYGEGETPACQAVGCEGRGPSG